MKYTGDLASLQDLVLHAGHVGEWKKINHGWQFRSTAAGVLNFFNTGTIVCQGQDLSRHALFKTCWRACNAHVIMKTKIMKPVPDIKPRQHVPDMPVNLDVQWIDDPDGEPW